MEIGNLTICFYDIISQVSPPRAAPGRPDPRKSPTPASPNDQQPGLTLTEAGLSHPPRSQRSFIVCEKAAASRMLVSIALSASLPMIQAGPRRKVHGKKPYRIARLEAGSGALLRDASLIRPSGIRDRMPCAPIEDRRRIGPPTTALILRSPCCRRWRRSLGSSPSSPQHCGFAGGDEADRVAGFGADEGTLEDMAPVSPCSAACGAGRPAGRSGSASEAWGFLRFDVPVAARGAGRAIGP